MARRFNPEAQLPIEVELQREKATALGRAGRKLEQLIEQLHRIEREAARLHGGARAHKVSEHAAVRREAEQQRWKMIVQREAMGLSRHDDLDHHYPLPPPLR